jgi:hypothetical protein
VISATENSNKFQKPGFGRKNQLKTGNTWANGTSHTNMFLSFDLAYKMVYMFQNSFFFFFCGQISPFRYNVKKVPSNML